jgi:hypothetical protein
MLHDGGQGHRERFCEFTDRDVAAAFKFSQQSAPGRISDGSKHTVQMV